MNLNLVKFNENHDGETQTETYTDDSSAQTFALNVRIASLLDSSSISVIYYLDFLSFSNAGRWNQIHSDQRGAHGGRTVGQRAE